MRPLSPVVGFHNVLSLEYLFEYWSSKRSDPNPVMAGLSEAIAQIAAQHPELTGTISDMSLMSKSQAILAPLWSTIIPATSVETEMMAVTLPFEMTPVYATVPFLAMMEVKKNHSQHDVKTSHQILLSSWRFVLSQLYGLNEGMPPAAVIDWEDSEGLQRFSRVDINHAFCRVVATGALPEMTPEFRKELLDSANDPGRLAALVPTDLFEFRGFVVLRAVDITGIEIVSRLKYFLIGDRALTDPVNYQAILNLVRAALRKPTVELALVAYRGDQVIMLQQAVTEMSDCILTSQGFGPKMSFEGTLYGRTHEENRPFAVLDLKEAQDDPKLKMLYQDGIRSVLTVPLSSGASQVGIAVLCSPDPTGVSAGDLDVLSEILPLLALGVRRSVENLDRQVQQIIQRNWTSIHPAVAWKFEKEAAQSLIGGTDSMKPIVFENVSPLYAVSDIRNSSVHRSQAILADLNRQLELGLQVIQAARKDRPLPLLEELEYRMRILLGQRTG